MMTRTQEAAATVWRAEQKKKQMQGKKSKTSERNTSKYCLHWRRVFLDNADEVH